MPARSLPSTIFLQSHCCADVVDHDGEWKTPLGFSSRGAFSLQSTFAYSAASFSFFSGRTLSRTDAGFAANHLSSPVNGALKERFGKDPFTGEDKWFAAKPASVRLKVRPLKKLKDAAL